MELEVKKISQILEEIKNNFKIENNNRFRLWFRGQQKFDDKLIPPIFRQGKEYQDILYYESNMFSEFLLLSDVQAFYKKSTFEKLVLMQHYGIPTRLLDWTENLLVALHFALYEPDIDGALFILDPISLNNVSEHKEGMFIDGNNEVVIRASLSLVNNLQEFVLQPDIKNLAKKNNFSLDLVSNKLLSQLQKSIETPIAVMPQQNNPRLINQKGTFTLHGGKIIGNNQLINCSSLEENEKIRLLKVHIKGKYKKFLKEELQYCGINKSTLFPELAIQSNFIKNKWSEKIHT